jgi:hypothetical protein
MPALDFIKQYAKPIIGAVIGISILIIIYKMVIKVSNAGSAIGGVIIDKAADTAISNQLGVSPERLHVCRKLANDLSKELETNKDFNSLTDGWFNVCTVDDLLDIFKQVKSYNEMIAVKNYYSSDFTNGNDLRTDITKQFTILGINNSSDAFKFKYSEAI